MNNFEFSIIEIIDSNLYPDRKKIKEKLNELEIFYIEKYDSFNNGYNLTIGGDSISGYKFSEDKREKASEISFKIQNDGRNKVFVYNVQTKEYSESPTLKAFLISIGSKSRHATTTSIIIQNKWIVARSKEELENKIQTYSNQTIRNNGKFTVKTDFSEELISDLRIME